MHRYRKGGLQMVIELVTLLIGFMLFLFTLYVLSREDFVFLRKNIILDDIFNVAFVTFFFTVFFSRFFYVLTHFETSYLNPLVFFLIPYFPGLSLTGGIIGGVLTLLVITKKKKYPRGRFLDFFAFALLSVLPIGYLIGLADRGEHAIIFSLLPVLYYALLFFFFLRILLPRFLEGQLKDGMLGLLFLMNYALFTAVLAIVKSLLDGTVWYAPETVILGLVFFISLYFYLKQGAQLNIRRLK